MTERGPDAAVTLGVLCRADEPALDLTLASLARAADRLAALGRPIAFAVCVNGAGPGEETAAHRAAESFARLRPPGEVRLIREAKADKARAWNLVRRTCSSPLLVFCDADVEVGEEALARLVAMLDARPEILLASARQVPLLDGASFVARAAALPCRFDLGVVSGQLYAMRTDAVAAMPEDLLFEDAWLSARLGRDSLATVPDAEVRFHTASTLADYYRQRLRTEAGKIQIRRERAADPARQSDRETADRRARRAPIARYPWGEMLRGLTPRDWPLLALHVTVRVVARAVAEYRVRRGRAVPWVTIRSSKPARVAGAGLGR